MENISYCRYLTDNWDQAKNKEEHYKALNIVKAIKGDPFNGFTRFRIGILNSANRDVAFQWFVDRVASETQFTPGTHYLCPIPDSQRTPTSTHTCRTLVLAQRLAQRIPELRV